MSEIPHLTRRTGLVIPVAVAEPVEAFRVDEVALLEEQTDGTCVDVRRFPLG